MKEQGTVITAFLPVNTTYRLRDVESESEFVSEHVCVFNEKLQI